MLTTQDLVVGLDGVEDDIKSMERELVFFVRLLQMSSTVDTEIWHKETFNAIRDFRDTQQAAILALTQNVNTLIQTVEGLGEPEYHLGLDLFTAWY